MSTKHPDTPSVPWVRSPRQLDFFRDWSPGEVKLWTALNSATQINTRTGRISVPSLARYTGYSERSIYRILRRLKNRGAVYSLASPGRTSVYYLPVQYCAPRFTPTPAKVVSAPNKEVIDKTNNTRRAPYNRYRPYLPPPPAPHLRANCYQSYNEYCATTNRPVSLDTWVAGLEI
jgi:hypothetical protein